MARVKTSEVIKALAELLENEYPPARVSALYALGRSRDDAAILPVLKTLKDESPDVRVAVCIALTELGAASKAGMLPYDDKDPQVRLAALQVAARLKASEAASPVQKRYGVEKEDVLRAEVFVTLAALGGPLATSLAEKRPAG